MTMTFNFGNIRNQTLRNVFPQFANVADGVVINESNFVTQLMATMSANCGSGAGSHTSVIGTLNTTPAAPCAPGEFTFVSNRRENSPKPSLECGLIKFDSKSKIKPNEGSLPMDLEIDVEETNPFAGIAAAKSNSPSKFSQHLLGVSEPGSVLVNGVMSSGINTAANYMFFPTTTETMLMDQSAMVAAAMQRMQNYIPDTASGSSVIVEDASTEQTVESFSQSMKEVIKMQKCLLYPPNPRAPQPTIRERPSGCRTVFVGGLPENATEEIVREIFESCGEITTLRMSKKNFCHIRYRNESSIERAIFFSGYRLRILTANEPANFGRLHVDYAQARDDQYDYECKQRQLQREQRHRDRVALDHMRAQSPPPIPHYTDHEASLVSENLRSNESFIKAVQTMIAWLERGDCSKRNANIFYSMIQSTHAHVRRLHSDKQQLGDDLKKTRESFRKEMLSMSKQFTQIEKVFNAASHKKVWDHFSKAQRKNIDQWKKLATDLRSVRLKDDERDMSDEDRATYCQIPKRMRYDVEHLKDENDSLRCQMEALRNEISLERIENKFNSDFREKQIKVLQETIRNIQAQLIQTKSREQKYASTIEQMERKLKESAVKQLLLKTKIKGTMEKLKERENSRDSETTEEEVTEVAVNDDATEEIVSKARMYHICEKCGDQIGIGENGARLRGYNALNKAELDVTTLSCGCSTMFGINNSRNVSEKQVGCNRKGQNPAILSNEGEKIKSSKLLATSYVAFSEARIITLVAAYLIVHPLGVGSEYICAYLNGIIKQCPLNSKSLTKILNKYTDIFNAGPNTNHVQDLQVKWKFCGFMSEESRLYSPQ